MMSVCLDIWHTYTPYDNLTGQKKTERTIDFKMRFQTVQEVHIISRL